MPVAAPSQFTLDFEPGLVERYPRLTIEDLYRDAKAEFIGHPSAPAVPQQERED